MRTWRQSAFLAVLAASLLSSAEPPLAAQSIRGNAGRRVNGAPIPGATVSLITEPGTQPVASTTTGSDGTFALTASSPGVYRLLAELPGYRASATPAMELPAGLTVSFTWRILPTTYRLVPIVIVETNRRPSGQQTDFSERIRGARRRVVASSRATRSRSGIPSG